MSICVVFNVNPNLSKDDKFSTAIYYVSVKKNKYPIMQEEN